MAVQVTALYGALLGIVYLVLMGLVGRERGRVKVSLGGADDPGLIEADRRHMNFVENVPLALILLVMVELNGGNRTLLHVLGAALLVARIVHPFGLSVEKMGTPARGAGAGITALVMLVSIGALLWQVATR